MTTETTECCADEVKYQAKEGQNFSLQTSAVTILSSQISFVLFLQKG